MKKNYIPGLDVMIESEIIFLSSGMLLLVSIWLTPAAGIEADEASNLEFCIDEVLECFCGIDQKMILKRTNRWVTWDKKNSYK